MSQKPLWQGVSKGKGQKKELPQVLLSKEIIRKLKQGEFWVYKEKVKNFHELQKLLPNGGFVRLPLGGLCLFDAHNPIALRALDVQNRKSDARPYIKKTLLRALGIRKTLYPFLNLTKENSKINTVSGIRLLHGENDFLPGLTADFYQNLIVYRLDSLAWFAFLKDIDSILRKELSIKYSYVSSRYVKGWLADSERFVEEKNFSFKENNFLFEINPALGQKSGFFLDMRANRSFIEKICQNKKVLNAFSYTCAFSLYALRGGASSVTNVDISEDALDAGKRNHQNNHLSIEEVDFICQDVNLYLKTLTNVQGKEKGKFDLIILDPPAYTHSQEKIENALNAYKNLNKEALLKLSSGQFLATASCSPRIGYQDFLEQVMQAADQSKRRLRLLYSQGADCDHPYVPNQTFEPYLKFLLFYVENN